MRRYLALFLPRWPIQHLQAQLPATKGQPVALFERSKRGRIVRVCSAEAVTLGVRGGMTVSDAKAATPRLLLRELNPPQCQAALRELCLWSTRFSPLAGVEDAGPHAPIPQTLLLDISGCEQVFGGEEKLLGLAVSSLKKQGFKARAAIAPTLGAAWALSHYGPATAIAPGDPGALRALLAPLPLAALRLSGEILAFFRPLGLQRIGGILRQPRASLPSRFGKDLLQRLDQALGAAPEILAPLRAAPEFRVARAFEYPARSSEVLFQILERMVERLARDLKHAQRGARHIECWLHHEIAAPACAGVALHRCSCSRKHLWQLLRTRLEDLFRAPRKSSCRSAGLTIEAEEGVAAVALHVTASEPVTEQQLPLFERAREEDAASVELSLLLDRLVTRLGPAAVSRVQLEDDPLPERAFRLLAPLTLPSPKGRGNDEAPRPLRLLAQPLPVRVDWPRAVWNAGRRQAIRSISGPERIESGWWRERGQRRDYYIVVVESGARCWLFEDPSPRPPPARGGRNKRARRWFLHGWFD